jgi:para-nitrobenzyl esterase
VELSLNTKVKNGVRSIYGIRYARAERFQDSALLETIEQFAGDVADLPTAPQTPGTVEKMLGTPPLPMSEDCLFLNVFAPESVGHPVPVLVWIHGGAYLNGNGATPWYDGTNLAKHGFVVVTINYRLGAFGFLGDNNWGLGDQLNALRWVNNNISNFGGDPENVTIFGESAGGSSVIALMASPGIEQIASRVVALSPSLGQYRDQETARLREGEFRSALLAKGINDATTCSVDEILAAQTVVVEARDRGFNSFSPTHGGTHLAADINEAAARCTLPLVIGTTKDENRLFTAFDPALQNLNPGDVVKRMRPRFGDRAEAVYQQYSENHPTADPSWILSAVETDGTFRVPARDLARRRAEHGADTYVYWFTTSTVSFDGILGSCHAMDIPFVFDNLDKPGISFFLGEIPQAGSIATWFSRKVLEFASGQAPWSPFTMKDKAIVEVCADPKTLVDHDSELLALWD